MPNCQYWLAHNPNVDQYGTGLALADQLTTELTTTSRLPFEPTKVENLIKSKNYARIAKHKARGGIIREINETAA